MGKSTVTANLAVALAQQGHAVALIDADVYGPTMPLMLGLPNVRPATHDGKLVPPEAHGVKVVSMGLFLDGDEPVIWRGPMLGRAIEQFLGDVLWGSPDFLLIDLPPGTGDIALTVAQMIPDAEMVIVTTPQEAAARTAAKAAKMAQMTKHRVAGRHREHGLLRLPDVRHDAPHLRARRRVRDRPPHGHEAARSHPPRRSDAAGRRRGLAGRPRRLVHRRERCSTTSPVALAGAAGEAESQSTTSAHERH